MRAIHDEALEAKSSPAVENAFLQFRLNQWVQQSTRFVPLHLWDADETDNGELAWLQARLDIGGVAADSERTWIEITTYGTLRRDPAVDWATVGMVTHALTDP